MTISHAQALKDNFVCNFIIRSDNRVERLMAGYCTRTCSFL